ncbi:MAG: hypothetical protein OXD33_13380 [Rhodobacteraceae bacterium]|nr:hypothetical protein [Paracoccaceae bacterium]
MMQMSGKPTMVQLMRGRASCQAVWEYHATGGADTPMDAMRGERQTGVAAEGHGSGGGRPLLKLSSPRRRSGLAMRTALTTIVARSSAITVHESHRQVGDGQWLKIVGGSWHGMPAWPVCCLSPRLQPSWLAGL